MSHRITRCDRENMGDDEKEKEKEKEKEQGRIHGYLSRVRVGRSSEAKDRRA